LSTIKADNSYYELLPLGRNPSKYSYLPSKSFGSPPVRNPAVLAVIQADAVILNMQTPEWFLAEGARNFRQVVPPQSMERVIEVQDSEDISLRIAIQAYQKQIPAFLPSQLTGRKINLVA
jgi:hypothetical protein